MKKYFFIYALLLCTFVGCKDNSGLYGLLNDYDYRISELEILCNQMNTNILSLQTIVESEQTGDYIISITPIMENGVEIGYTITFAQHAPITIYHGKNGKDGKDGKDGQNGTNGTNGQDGHTPIVGVAQDTDGVYYWTLDGTWLLDGNGSKICVTGKDGQDGTNGTNGTDGANGTDGITPQLKIEADYWWISYDNGATWTQLGKAKGDKGDPGNDGTNGTNGQDGDSMFQSVTQDSSNVYFTLTNGTTITISKNIGPLETNVENGHVYIDLGLPSGTMWAACNIGGHYPTDYGDYYILGATTPNILPNTSLIFDNVMLTKNDSLAGGIYDAAHVNWGGKWEIPTKACWDELQQYCSKTCHSGYVIFQSSINKRSIYFPLDDMGTRTMSNVYSDVSYSDKGYYLTSTLKSVSIGEYYEYYILGIIYTEHYLRNWAGLTSSLSLTYSTKLSSSTGGIMIRPVFHP